MARGRKPDKDKVETKPKKNKVQTQPKKTAASVAPKASSQSSSISNAKPVRTQRAKSPNASPSLDPQVFSNTSTATKIFSVPTAYIGTFLFDLIKFVLAFVWGAFDLFIRKILGFIVALALELAVLTLAVAGLFLNLIFSKILGAIVSFILELLTVVAATVALLLDFFLIKPVSALLILFGLGMLIGEDNLKSFTSKVFPANLYDFFFNAFTAVYNFISPSEEQAQFFRVFLGSLDFFRFFQNPLETSKAIYAALGSKDDLQSPPQISFLNVLIKITNVLCGEPSSPIAAFLNAYKVLSGVKAEDLDEEDESQWGMLKQTQADYYGIRRISDITFSAIGGFIQSLIPAILVIIPYIGYGTVNGRGPLGVIKGFCLGLWKGITLPFREANRNAKLLSVTPSPDDANHESLIKNDFAQLKANRWQWWSLGLKPARVRPPSGASVSPSVPGDKVEDASLIREQSLDEKPEHKADEHSGNNREVEKRRGFLFSEDVDQEDSDQRSRPPEATPSHSHAPRFFKRNQQKNDNPPTNEFKRPPTSKEKPSKFRPRASVSDSDEPPSSSSSSSEEIYSIR